MILYCRHRYRYGFHYDGPRETTITNTDRIAITLITPITLITLSKSIALITLIPLISLITLITFITRRKPNAYNADIMLITLTTLIN